MTDNRPSHRAMEKIMKGEIKKRSRTRFVFVNIALWFFGVLSIMAGAVLIGIIILTFANGDMDLHREIYGCAFPRMTFVMIGMWILLTGLFVILCDVSVRHTNRGYVYPLWLIVLSNIFLSGVFGFVFYKIGVSYHVDRLLGDHVQHYYNVDKRRAMLYNLPDKGIVMGHVVVHEPTYVIMMTPDRAFFTVATGYLDDRKKSFLAQNEQVVFLGKVNEDGVFVACDMRTRQLNGAPQVIKERLLTEINVQKILEQKDQIIEHVRVTTYQIPYICDEKVRWRMIND